jgi:hypothetical protein
MLSIYVSVSALDATVGVTQSARIKQETFAQEFLDIQAIINNLHKIM